MKQNETFSSSIIFIFIHKKRFFLPFLTIAAQQAQTIYPTPPDKLKARRA
jgi:hypothetical protein